MTVKSKAELVKKTIRTTTRAFNLKVAKEVEDQAKALAEAEPQTQTQTPLSKGSDFKGNP